jgi:hypothetical protein
MRARLEVRPAVKDRKNALPRLGKALLRLFLEDEEYDQALGDFEEQLRCRHCPIEPLVLEYMAGKSRQESEVRIAGKITCLGFPSLITDRFDWVGRGGPDCLIQDR